MASRLLLLAVVLVFCIEQVSADAEVEDHETKTVKGMWNLHSRPNRCNRACGTCCVRCKCVPTAGNGEVCGSCYTDMTTHGNRLKCP
ncbi:hypothetical protein ACLB2K_043227 [Fragaria x ananassa]